MKFKLVDDLDEVYFTDKNLKVHYDKHVSSDKDGDLKLPDMTPDEYNNLADELSSADASKINNKEARIIGYVADNGKIVKYDRLTNYVVAYVDDNVKGHEAVSFYKQPINKFFKKLNDECSPYHFKSHIK